MSRITIGDVSTTFPSLTNSYDIVNAIRNEATPEFRQYVPLANAENVAQVGAGIMVNPITQNEFLVQLINRIGLTVIKHKALNNPLR